MIKQYILEDNGNGRLISDEPFLLQSGEQLEIAFSNGQATYVVDLQNGDVKQRMIVSNGTFIVPSDFVVSGELNIIVRLYDDLKYPKKWLCEPISIIQVADESFEIYSVFAKLAEQIERLESRVQAFEQTLSFKATECDGNIARQVDTLQKQIDELWQAVEQ